MSATVCQRLAARIKADRARNVETSGPAREFVLKTCSEPACVARRAKARGEAKKAGRGAEALKSFIGQRRQGLCAKCPKRSLTTYCPDCLAAICTPGSRLWRGGHAAAKAQETVGTERARLDAGKGVRFLGPEEKARLEQEMRAAGRLR